MQGPEASAVWIQLFNVANKTGCSVPRVVASFWRVQQRFNRLRCHAHLDDNASITAGLSSNLHVGPSASAEVAEDQIRKDTFRTLRARKQSPFLSVD